MCEPDPPPPAPRRLLPPPGPDRRRADRSDSSESSDSGVAVLSSTDSGCSGSDLTEPGSPYSPASSSSSSEECGGKRLPPWSPSHHSRKRNLETLIADRLQPKKPARLLPIPAQQPRPQPQQGRITEYFNHKMKSHNGLKREITCWNKLDDAKRKCTQKAAVAQDIEKYISLLSQTLSPKVLLDVAKKAPSECVNPGSKGVVDTRNCPLPSLIINGVPNTRQDANKVNGSYGINTFEERQRQSVNGVTCGSNNFVLNNDCNNINTRKPPVQKKPRKLSRRSLIAGRTTWYKLEDGEIVKHAATNENDVNPFINLPVDKSSVNYSDTAPKITMANSNNMRQIPITFNGTINNMHQLPMANTQNCNIINVSQHCNGTVTTSATLSPFVAVPQTVMLTTLRIPQNNNPQQPMNMPQSNGINGFTRQNMNIASPTKINGQFVFPYVQNINGTVVQIPNIVTKVGPNFVIPHPHMQPQRQDTQQVPQMLINGTLVKLTTSVAPTYTEMLTKPTTTSNIPFPVMNKSMNTGMPTVMTAKPQYTVNMGHSMLMPRPGIFINPMPNNISKETYANIEAPSNYIQTNNNNTFPTMQPPIIQSLSSCNQVSSSSIPIPPVKPPDKDTGTLESAQQSIATINENETMTCEQKNIYSSYYPNLTRLLNSNAPLPQPILSRPFAQVSKSTEKLLDFAPMDDGQLDTDEMTSSFEEIQDEMDTSSPIEEISPASTPESDLFTQITVNKDVTSDVQNTILETTFSCGTSESTESGIGTDKSIDSPSDSMTSKECDDDSLSLSVSVCSVDVQPGQKSPILKEPKTIRFPRISVEQKQCEQRTKGKRSARDSVTVCRWDTCTESFDSDTDLLEHLQVAHVNSQVGRENYMCLWSGCKVHSKPSCSRLWIERHALSHGGNKPFKCIVDDCDRRFSTQMLLEKHVNNHFDEQASGVNGGKRSADSGPKLIRRNGKVLRYRRQPWSARMFDFFDGGMMEGLQWRLMRATGWRSGAAPPPRPLEAPGQHTLTLAATLTATRYNTATGRREALVTYNPPHVLDDEWIPEDEFQKTRDVDMCQLPTRAKVLLYDQFCSSYRSVCTHEPADSETAESSKMLNKLFSKQQQPAAAVEKSGLKVEVSGAAKRKQGRRYGGNAFWPSGR